MTATEQEFSVGKSYTIRRTQTPLKTVGIAMDLESTAWNSLGGQAEWFWGLPGVFHALASPRTGQSVPAAPSLEPLAAHSASLGYWAPLQYLLLYRLGWRDPGKGLTAWYDAGKPTDDPTLALVAEVWDRDGYLDTYLAWLLKRQPKFLDEARPTETSLPEVPMKLVPSWQSWIESVVASARLEPAPHFSLSGYDSLHLTGHAGEGGVADADATLTVVNTTKKLATFATNSMGSWYWDLMTRARELPASNRSWHLDVFVRPVGYLGNYRISRSTSLLFTGRHRYHEMGN